MKTASPTAITPSDRGGTSRRRGASPRRSPASRCQGEGTLPARRAPRRPGLPRRKRLPAATARRLFIRAFIVRTVAVCLVCPACSVSLLFPLRRPPSRPSSAPASSTRVTDGSASTVSVPFTLCPSIANTYGYSPGSNPASISANVSFSRLRAHRHVAISSTISPSPMSSDSRSRVCNCPTFRTVARRDSTATRPESP